MTFSLEQNIMHHGEQSNLLLPVFDDLEINNQLQYLSLEENDQNSMVKQLLAQPEQRLLIPFGGGNLLLKTLPLGKGSEFDTEAIYRRCCRIGRELVGSWQLLMENISLDEAKLTQLIEVMVRGLTIGSYQLNKEKLKQVQKGQLYSIRRELCYEENSCHITVIGPEHLQEAIWKGNFDGISINYARMLGDLPNNYLHVSDFTDYLSDFAKEHQLHCEILGDKELLDLHSGGILGVNAGSRDEAKLVTIYYEWDKTAPVTALIGKGVMFDSGGYHLKSISGMQGMKYDMCGAANLLSALEIVVKNHSRNNILLVLPLVENVIGPDACKMGDVLTTMSGKTVEVYNIDAEGRLILCDAITYALQKGADYLIDLATLTYSCQRALGNEICGAYSNEDRFYEKFARTAKRQGEKLWRLPLDEGCRKLLYRTQTADLINYAPDRDGGANVAACFLEEFVGDKTPWIHLDFVGPAVNRGDNEALCLGATGAMAATVAAFLDTLL